MKQLYRNILCIALLQLSSGTKVFAYDAEIEGICYNFNKTGPMTASVTYRNYKSNDYSGDIVIPSSVLYNGNYYNVVSIGSEAFRDCTRLTNISIPNSVTSIDYQAFSCCTGLTRITIPNSVTSIGSCVFSNCTGLTSITIPNGVTSIGYQTFSRCTGLTSITIPNSVTSIGSSVFQGCTELISIIVEEGNAVYDSRDNCNAIIKTKDNELYCACKTTIIPNSVTSIGNYAFYDCIGLTSIIIPNSVTSIGRGAFENCTDLSSITIPNSVTIIGSGAFKATEWFNNQPDGVIYVGKIAYEYKGIMPQGTNIVIDEGTLGISEYAFSGFTGLISVTIPSSVTSIASSVFSGCTGLNSINIHNGVKNIGYFAFSGCTSLTSITIPNSVTSIGFMCFKDCSNLKSVHIGSGLAYMDNGEGHIFYNCPIIEEMVVDNQNKFYDSRNDCNAIIETESNTLLIGCKKTSIPEGITSIGHEAFSNILGLEKIRIPNSVKEIGPSAFMNCSGLTSITIPNSVMEIGHSAFNGCIGLTSITIPSFMTALEDNLFCGCTSLTDVIIERVVNKIDYGAFRNCSKLKTVVCKAAKVPSTDTHTFWNTPLSSATLYVPDNSIEQYKKNAPWSNFGKILSYEDLVQGDIGDLKYKVDETSKTAAVIGLSLEGKAADSLNIPSTINLKGTTYDVISINNEAFINCTNLTSIIIANGVKTIGEKAFSGCNNITRISVGDDVTTIGKNAFYSVGSNKKIFVKRGTLSLISLWNYGTIPYETGTTNILEKPRISISTTQTTATIKIENLYDEFTNYYSFILNGWYTIKAEKINKGSSTKIYNYKGLYPGEDFKPILEVELGNLRYKTTKDNYTTESINPTIKTINKSVTSISLIGTYKHGDAHVTNQSINLNGVTMNGDNIELFGLNPNTEYKATYSISVAYGENEEYSRGYSTTATIRTSSLSITTQQPKVISAGNVIVAAETNIEDAEKNVGFEWRRIDWTDDFASNSGTAYLYNGTMEGYIRNLYTEKLWKYRPYYESASGNRYYGEWVGIDPTNTSYFEPTVHTYANITMQGNSVSVKGYAMRGTENITSQGFKYWPNTTESRSYAAGTSIPKTAITVLATGTVMEAELTGLEYETEYSYVAYVTTSEGETFYGDVRSFTTGPDFSGIEDTTTTAADAVPTAYYDMRGRHYSTPQHGLNIIRMSDGTTRKMIIK